MCIAKLKQLKKKIIESYEGVLNDDEYCIITTLLKKEKDALHAMNRHGTYSLSATKHCGKTTLSTGGQTKMCNYVNSSLNQNNLKKKDTDIGYTSFL